MSDINVIEPTQSFTGNLGVNASFLGAFIDVQAFTSITVTASGLLPPASSNAIQFEWSEDGVTLDSTTVFGSDASTQQTVHGTVRAAFFRVRYTAGGSGQTNARIQTLLRTGPYNGSVSRVGLITGSPDALISNGVIFAKNNAGNFTAIRAVTDTNVATDNWLGVLPPPNRANVVVQNITATISSSPEFDFFNLNGPQRRWITVFNNTVRGNLYLKYNGAASTTTYDFKIPPQHSWTMPWSWVLFGGTGGTLFGIWDFADGNAHVTEGI